MKTNDVLIHYVNVQPEIVVALAEDLFKLRKVACSLVDWPQTRAERSRR